jgi:hypothetical protein
MHFIRQVYHTALLTLAFLSAFCSAVIAQTLDQWADQVVGFSSQWRTREWSAHQALGPSNTFGYGSIRTSWSPLSKNDTVETLTVGFAIPVYATGATIRETFGNGFVTRVDALDVDGQFHTVWSGVDPSRPGSPVDFHLAWPQTTFAVRGLRIYVNTNLNRNTYEEIDSIRLHGVPVFYSQWASGISGFSSQWSDTRWAAHQALGPLDTYGYGDIVTAWTPFLQNGTQEFLQLDYATPVYAQGVVIRETWGNGFVTRVDLIDTENSSHTVWTGTDSSLPTSSVNFLLLFPKTPYIVKGVQVTINTNHNPYTWEEIDAVCLLGERALLSGAIHLEDCADQAVPMTLEFRPVAGGDPILRATTPASNGDFLVEGVPNGDYRLAVKGAKWLRKVVPVSVDGNGTASIVVSLLGGDANDDNTVDVLDLALLIQTFDSRNGDPNWDASADFNNDASVDVLDLNILICNFDRTGDS